VKGKRRILRVIVGGKGSLVALSLEKNFIWEGVKKEKNILTTKSRRVGRKA